VRAHDRKVAQTEGMPVAIAHDGRPYRVASCWILRDTAANRGLVARYPAILGSRFRGSSLAWTRALTASGPTPPEPGLLWASTNAERLMPLRWRV
jgi:hypothetical protein